MIKEKVLRKIKPKLPVLAIIFFTLLAYVNALKDSFVWDDHYVIVANDFIRSWHNLHLIFSRAYFESFVELTYRPVVTLSYFLDYSIWKLNPLGLHLDSVLLHAFNAVLFFSFLNLVFKKKAPALFAALLFALHPVNSEAVSVISFRDDLLAFMFFFSSFILYIKSTSRPGSFRISGCYILSLALFVFALFSKEMAVTLPLFLALYDHLFDGNKKAYSLLKRFKLYYLGYFLITLFYLCVRFIFMENPAAAKVVYPGGNFYTNILTMSRVFAHYLYLAFFPARAHLILHGNSFISGSFFNPGTLFSVLLIAACFIFALWVKNRSKVIFFSFALFFVALIPVANIIPIPNFAANRYLYIPITGFCLFLSAAIFQLPRVKSPFFARMQKSFLFCAMAAILIFYAAFTAIRNISYRSDAYLWSEMVEAYPDSFEAHSWLGWVYLSQGLFDQAIREYEAAINLTPKGAKTEDYFYLGLSYRGRGMLEEAIASFNKAIALGYQKKKAYYYLGLIFKSKGSFGQAKQSFEEAIKIDRGFVEARNELERLK
ncbi:MAG: tetratricopeptide repeat protein [Candidatus Omnitrophica bacterium]|nr:tetratricopeptide repeat protein [Candidatus Omnitrophota bacterium]